MLHEPFISIILFSQTMNYPLKADLVFPNGNEKELALELKALGFTEAVFCYGEKVKADKAVIEARQELQKALKLTIRTAILLSDRKGIAKARNRADLLISPPTREFFEDKRVDAILGPGLEQRKDSPHFRRSLTQVEANLAKAQKKTVLYSLTDLQAAKRKPELLGRWAQDTIILRKKGARFRLVSAAKDVLGLRGRKDLELFWEALR
ncbi:hypothetical protein DRQ25_16140 [Candidatus Fermentibacteria bacterium]|nr:MAG: hypothetical protein DRQ25_16140 [Candidatus Fermentibacteria bacterium]